MKRYRKPLSALLILFLLTAFAMGLSYRQGRNLYELEPLPRCDMNAVSYQVFFGEDSRALNANNGLANIRIFESVGSLTFHRAASNLIAQPLGLWYHPDAEPQAEKYAFLLTFKNQYDHRPVVSLFFSGDQWYYQNTTMDGYLPCSVTPNGIPAGEALGKMLWEMTPVWEKYYS
jgi:hypothetical protein